MRFMGVVREGLIEEAFEVILEGGEGSKPRPQTALPSRSLPALRKHRPGHRLPREGPGLAGGGNSEEETIRTHCNPRRRVLHFGSGSPEPKHFIA